MILSPDLQLQKKHLDSIQQFLTENEANWGIHGGSLLCFLQQGYMNRQCTCGFYYAFIRSSGDVHLCPLIVPAVGSLQKDTFSSIWFSQQAKAQRCKIGSCEVCRHCTEPGLERYALVHEGWSYLALLFKNGPHRFTQLHAQLGLQNYF